MHPGEDLSKEPCQQLLAVHLDLRHVVVQPPVVDQLEYDPQTLGGLVQLVHTHDVSVSYPLHDLDLRGHALRVVHLRVLAHHFARKGLLRNLMRHQHHLPGRTMPQYLPEIIRLSNHTIGDLIMQIEFATSHFGKQLFVGTF